MTLFDSDNRIHVRIPASFDVSSVYQKRLFDLTLAVVGVAFLGPLLCVVAMLLAVEHRSWPIFRQERRGLNGRSFRIWKFRTMTVSEDGGSVVAVRQGDARVTRFGAFLRRTSIDELPQLANVILGEMSLVGPRPHALIHDDMLEKSVHGYSLRRAVRPGITGLAQISGHRGEMKDLAQMHARTELDLQYVSNWSLLGDIQIMWLTLFSPAARHNAR